MILRTFPMKKCHFRVIAFCDNLRDMSQKNIIPELVYLTLE